MAMNLIDRPALTEPMTSQHRAGGVTASVAVHLTIMLALIAVVRTVPPASVSSLNSSLIPDHLIWLPSIEIGGGRDGGGERSIDPPRRLREIGRDPVSVPNPPPQPSDQITTEAPTDSSAIPAKPMADSMATLAGVIDADPASLSAGPGSTGVGTAPDSGQGAFGDRPGPGVGPGDAIRGGAPGVTVPTVIQQVRPSYTADAMRMRIQGVAMVECVVMPDGTVGDARIIRSLDSRFGLDAEAIAAAKRWRFRPGTLHGKPVPVIVTIELTFSVR